MRGKSPRTTQLIGLLKECTAHLETTEVFAPILHQTLGALHAHVGVQISLLESRYIALEKQQQQQQVRKLHQQEAEEEEVQPTAPTTTSDLTNTVGPPPPPAIILTAKKADDSSSSPQQDSSHRAINVEDKSQANPIEPLSTNFVSDKTRESNETLEEEDVALQGHEVTLEADCGNIEEEKVESQSILIINQEVGDESDQFHHNIVEPRPLEASDGQQAEQKSEPFEEGNEEKTMDNEGKTGETASGGKETADQQQTEQKFDGKEVDTTCASSLNDEGEKSLTTTITKGLDSDPTNDAVYEQSIEVPVEALTSSENNTTKYDTLDPSFVEGSITTTATPGLEIDVGVEEKAEMVQTDMAEAISNTDTEENGEEFIAVPVESLPSENSNKENEGMEATSEAPSCTETTPAPTDIVADVQAETDEIDLVKANNDTNLVNVAQCVEVPEESPSSENAKAEAMDAASEVPSSARAGPSPTDDIGFDERAETDTTKQNDGTDHENTEQTVGIPVDLQQQRHGSQALEMENQPTNDTEDKDTYAKDGSRIETSTSLDSNAGGDMPSLFDEDVSSEPEDIGSPPLPPQQRQPLMGNDFGSDDCEKGAVEVVLQPEEDEPVEETADPDSVGAASSSSTLEAEDRPPDNALAGDTTDTKDSHPDNVTPDTMPSNIDNSDGVSGANSLAIDKLAGNDGHENIDACDDEGADKEAGRLEATEEARDAVDGSETGDEPAEDKTLEEDVWF